MIFPAMTRDEILAAITRDGGHSEQVSAILITRRHDQAKPLGAKPGKRALHRDRSPRTAARCWDAACIQSGREGAERRGAALAQVLDGGKEIGGPLLGPSSPRLC